MPEDMNAEHGGARPEGVTPPEHTAQSEANKTNQSAEGQTPRDSIFPETRVDRPLGFTPALAGGPSIENTHPFARVRSAINNAQEEGIPDNTLMAVSGTGGAQRGGGRSGGTTAEGGRPPGGGLIGRREFLIGAATVSGGAALAGAELQTGFIRKGIRGAINFFRGGKDNKGIVVPGIAKDEDTPPPTVIPEATKTPEPIPPFPEKYNFGENNEYFKSYANGKIATGSESGRAELTHIEY